MIWPAVIAVFGSVAAAWLIFLVVLLAVKPDQATLAETARIIPDTARLVRRLASDRTLARMIRLRLWCLLVYLALPVDLVPDFIPVIGYADDAILTGLVLRSVIRRGGPDRIRRYWPGTPDGLAMVARLCQIPELAVQAAAHQRDARDIREATATRPSTSPSLRSGVVLEALTLGWNVIGIAVLAVAAITARSVALAGFGLDSLIEIGASTVVIWELSGSGEQRQRKALRIVGAMFVVLAIYLGIQSTYVIATRHHARHSTLGIVWTAITAVVMFTLAGGKARVGRALNNRVLVTEGQVTMIDALLATAVLAGLALNAGLDWWWADPAAGFLVLFYGLKEGTAALRHP